MRSVRITVVAAGLCLAACAPPAVQRGEKVESPPAAGQQPAPADAAREEVGFSDRLQLARQALGRGDYRSAAQQARAAGQLEPTAVAPKQLEAQTRQAMGDLAGALPLWRQTLQLGSRDPADWGAYATLALRRGQGEAALDDLRRDPQVLSQEVELAAVTGWLALALGQAETARQLLEAAQLEPSPRQRYGVMLGRSRLLVGDLSGAAELAAQLAGEGQGAEAWVLLGDARAAQGLFAGASDAYRSALAATPDHYAALVNLGVLLLGQAEYARAAELFGTAAERRPDAPQAWNNLGLARRQLGQWQLAQEAYEKALAVDPLFSDALKNLGVLHEKYLGRPQAALPLYQRYLQQVPGDEEVVRWHKTAQRLSAAAEE